jgi:hypothetical protein
MNPLTIPVGWQNLGFDRAISGDGLTDYCWGGSDAWGGAAGPPYTTRWMFNMGPDGVSPQVTINGVTYIQSLAMSLNAKVVSLTGCDGGAYVGPIVALEDGTIPPVPGGQPINLVRLRVNQDPVDFTTYFWSGRSPRLFNLELVGSSGVICYFLSPDGTKLKARLLADTWFVDYVLIDSLPVPLAKLTKVDANGTNIVLWALTQGSKRSEVQQVALVAPV